MLGPYRRSTRAPNRTLATFGVVFAVSLAILFVLDLNARYQDAIAHAKQTARNYAEIFAEHTDRAFEGVDRVLRVVEIIRRDARAINPAGIAAADVKRRVHEALRQLQQTSPLLMAVSWTDADGNIEASSFEPTPPRRNLAEFEQFAIQRERHSDEMFVTEPHWTLKRDRWILAASRRLTNAEGSFAGIANAPLNPTYFNSIFRAIDLGSGGAAMLFHSSGFLVAREPFIESFMGRSFANADVFAHLRQVRTGAYEVTGYYDGKPRISGYAAVRNLPLVALVSFDRAEVLAPWYRHLYTFGPMVAFVVLVILFGTVLLTWQTRKIARKSSELELTLDHITHGLVLIDRKLRVVVSNRRYAEMYRLDPELMKPRTPLRAVLEARVAAGTSPPDAENYIENRLREAKSVEPFCVVNHLADGRVVAVTHQPVPGFGAIGIHEDITAQKRAETSLIAKSEELALANARFDAALDNLPHGLCMYDDAQRLIVCNTCYREMYGLSPDQVRPGTTLRAVLEARVAAGRSPGDTQDYIERRLKEVVEGKPYQAVNALRDGRMIEVTHQPMADGGWVAIHQDVTAEKHGEATLIAKSEALRHANLRFDAALNNMTQGLSMFDADQRIVVANSRFAEIYGLTPDQVKPGTTAQEVYECRVANGTHIDVAPDQYVRRMYNEAADVQTLANGRVISILRQFLPDGSALTTHEDITDRRQNEAKVAYMAHHDLLTGLANRTLFMEKIQEAGARLRRRGEGFTVFMLDLDRFKDVNDSLGHPAGDAMLKEMAQRLRSSLRETDVLARLGGDEFAILQSGEQAQRESAIMLATRIIDVVGKPFDLDGRKVSVGTSIGIALAPQDGVDPDELMKKADLALYRTKSDGRNGFNFFNPGMTAEADARHQLENEMREAIAKNEFEIHYQPVVDIMTLEPRGAEALVRWRHPTKGVLGPDRFVRIAEDTGLIVQLGAWILQRACADAAAWPAHIKLAINLSPVQFRRGDLFDLILCALVDSGLAPERLEVEITESVLLENEAKYRVLLKQLKNIGISIVLDDFGTGYSSLGYLTTFPVDKIKIDKTFTQGLLERADCAAVVASVLTLARALDIATTAEGVETEEQLDMLHAAGVTMAQGYLFGRPRPVSELQFTAAEVSERGGSKERATTAA